MESLKAPELADPLGHTQRSGELASAGSGTAYGGIVWAKPPRERARAVAADSSADTSSVIICPRSRPSRLQGALIALGALVVAALSLLGLRAVDFAAAVSALTHADPRLLVIGTGFYILAQTIAGVMWWGCQNTGGIRLPPGVSLGIHWISRASCELLPASLGEGVRLALVRRHPQGAAAGAWRITGALVGTKVIETVVTALAVLAIALATPLPGPAAGIRWMALATVVAIAVICLAWRLGLAAGGRRVLSGRLRVVSEKLGQGAASLRDPAATRTAALLVLASLAARVVSLGFLLAAFDISPLAAPLVFAAITIAGILPGAPGGAGARELVLLPALAMAYGVPLAEALAFSVAIQATALAASLGAGLAALSWLGTAIIHGWSAEGSVPAVEPERPSAGLEALPVPAPPS